METKLYPPTTQIVGSTAISGTAVRPIVGGPGASIFQRMWLLVRSRLLISSIVLGVILVGGTSYIVISKTSLIKHRGAVTATTAGNSSVGSSSNQTTTTKPTSGSTTSTASSGGASTSASKATQTSGTPAKSGSSNTTTSPNTTTSGGTGTSGGTSSGGTTTGGGTTGGTTGGGGTSSGGTTTPSGSCFAVPSSCGYPDATNTGPVAGTVFTKVPEQATSGNGWTWDSRGWISVTGSNVTVNGIQTNADIDVTGSNVTIQNCIVSENNGDFGVSLRHTTNVTVKNCRISGTDASGGRLSVAIKSIYGDDVNPHSIANDISLVSTGIQYCQGLIQDNYIHDLGFQTGDHLNGTTSNDGCNQLTIQHNTIFNSFFQTDAVSLFQDFGREQNALVTNNYLAGGGYTIYGGGGSNGTATNIQITNNRISDYYYANGGGYGWLAAWDGGGSGNVCSGNVLEHVTTGKTDPLGC